MARFPENLLNDVHSLLKPPSQPSKTVVGQYAYYHYLCDGFNDIGWGCGYRTLQTLCSFVCSSCYNNPSVKKHNVPSILEIQNALVSMKDKPSRFSASREWIGSFEVCLCLDHFYDVPCKIHHVRTNENVFEAYDVLWSHFEKFASPVMMGGDSDAASKCVLGVCGKNTLDCHLLILDPHCSAKPSLKSIVEESWLSWRKVDSFVKSSFYNFCLPQCASREDSSC